MNHYLFKYAIDSLNLFKKRRVTSVSIHTFSSFSIHFKDCEKYLYINLSSQNSFIFFSDIKLPSDKTVDTPFFLFLKKKLTGLILNDIRQEGSERYVYLFFEDARSNIINRFVMIVEMIDRMVNAIFTDEKYVILQAYKYTNASRVIFPRKKYDPPHSDMPDLLCEDMDKLVIKFKHNENILGLNGFLKKLLKNEKQFVNFVEKAKYAFENKKFRLCLYGNKYVYPFCFGDNCREIDNNFIIDSFILKQQKDDFKSRKKHLLDVVEKRLNTVKRKMKKIKKEFCNAEDADKYRITAENLLLNPNLDIKYKNKIIVKNVYTSSDMEIVLNPKMNIFDNAQHYFKKFKKAKKSRKIIEQRLLESKYELAFLEQLMFDIENAEDEKELNDVKDIIIKESIIRINNKRRSKQSVYVPYERVHIMGFDVYIGKNARGNDYVTMKLASKNDIWFHPRQRPGAHLILKNPSRLQNIDDNVKMKCACEVAKRTKAQNKEKVEIDYTFAKYVKKPKGLKIGLVLYSNFKTLVVQKNESC